MNELQKKVLLFLLGQFAGEMKEIGWVDDERAIMTLSEEDRKWLSIMLKSRGMSGGNDGFFSIHDLIVLAEYWLIGE